MLLTLALVVLFGSILVFFSEEFIKTFKKIFAIKGALLFIPLLIASWLVYTFDFWFLWAVFYLREILHQALIFLISILPFHLGAKSIALIILLTGISVVPVLIMDIFVRRKSYKGYQYFYVTSGVLWIIAVFLLMII